MQDIADSILWAPDRPAVDRLWEFADPDTDDPEMDPGTWVRALKYASQYGVCLHLGREKYMDCQQRRIYRLDGQPYPQRLTIRRPTAIDVVADASVVAPVPIEETPFLNDDE